LYVKTKIELSFIVINISPYPLCVTKDKPTHKENHVDDLKTMEEDCDTLSICIYKNFEKEA